MSRREANHEKAVRISAIDVKRGRFIDMASYFGAFIALIYVFKLELLSALFSGLLVYSLVDVFVSRLEARIFGYRSRVVAVVLISAVVVVSLACVIWGVIAFVQGDGGNVQVLFQKLADILDRSREMIPINLRADLPASADALRDVMIHWLREHALEAKSVGTDAGRTLAHILIGMIIGAMVVLYDTDNSSTLRPLARALTARISCFQNAFKKIVFAQTRISAINTAITGFFLFVILPVCGVHLSFSKTLLGITFVAGLLPVVGNLISNTIMVILGLAQSVYVALACLIFLVLIHKLEYFLNAHIIGSHIHARTWELLVGLLVMEALFGMSGVIAAPVFYAYIKNELMDVGLV